MVVPLDFSGVVNLPIIVVYFNPGFGVDTLHKEAAGFPLPLRRSRECILKQTETGQKTDSITTNALKLNKREN